MMITYKDTGVDVEKNDLLVNIIKRITGISTGFADVRFIGDNQFLAFSCDGVGTKIKLMCKRRSVLNTIGEDLVGMCANDLICSGAKPAFFMDYIGMNFLEEDEIKPVITSINNACKVFGMQLVGGEMAEMTNTYVYNHPELVGFAVGFGSTETKINKESVKVGDIIIGLESISPHSNGYSLINKIYERYGFSQEELDILVHPTRLYTEVCDLHFASPFLIKSMAHITGGGLYNNLVRAIPKGLNVKIDHFSWKVPEIYDTIQRKGNVEIESMWSTFNMGIGMCLIVSPGKNETVLENLQMYNAKVIGEVIDGE